MKYTFKKSKKANYSVGKNRKMVKDINFKPFKTYKYTKLAGIKTVGGAIMNNFPTI